MSSRFTRHIVVLVLALVATGVAGAWADHGPRNPPQNTSNMQNSQGGGLPASVRKIERETGGEVLKAQPIQRDGREVYRVKVLTPQGRIRVVEDQAPPHDEAQRENTDRPSRDRLPEE